MRGRVLLAQWDGVAVPGVDEWRSESLEFLLTYFSTTLVHIESSLPLRLYMRKNDFNL
eukprot:GDKH01008995.1.p4 GENE.GDKH01008995.1~~GDKH01008995.1.p4  ORF type:complete len:58 (-),score=7.15 GDKH01008995.1:37-210(-)